MKIVYRIIETILAITMLISGMMVTDAGCSCGQCYADEMQLATIVLFASIAVELVILSLKAKKQKFWIGLFDFVSNILIVLEMVLIAGLVIGTVVRIGDDGVSNAIGYCLPLLGVVAVVGGVIYLLARASKYLKEQKRESIAVTEMGEN